MIINHTLCKKVKNTLNFYWIFTKRLSMIKIMLNSKRKIYESLLNAESDARQIRSAKNKVIASNTAADTLFGISENP